MLISDKMREPMMIKPPKSRFHVRMSYPNIIENRLPNVDSSAKMIATLEGEDRCFCP